MKALIHISAAVFIFFLTGLGLGYRHIWQDEAETAERARTILESGLPRVIDSSGQVSLNSAGREIEEGNLHRYTPWAQFYVGAAGLKFGKFFGLTSDESLRLPFALAHALTSSLISFGLNSYALVPLPVSFAVALLFGVQTNRILHNRTARYHSLIDLFLMLGLLCIGAFRHERQWAKLLLALSIFFLPQFHTLGGSLMSLMLAAIFGIVLFFSYKREKFYLWFKYAAVPGLLALISLLALTRPWRQEAWGVLNSGYLLRSISNKSGIRYSLDFMFICGIFLLFMKEKKLVKSIFLILVILVGASALLDFHPFSQARYYFSIPLLCILWPVALGFGNLEKSRRSIIMILMCVFIVGPEFTTREHKPFQGLKIAISDFNHEGTKQPLHSAFDMIRAGGTVGDSVLVDYVPHFANWYLPGYKIALLPDISAKTKLNVNNPVWDRPLQMPKWHLWYPTFGTGPWTCMGHCDYFAHDLVKSKYLLTSQKLERTISMCVVGRWKTSRYNNAPFEMMKAASFNPEGDLTDELVLAKPCPK